MATNKKSFILYCDQINTFKILSDEEAGRLIKHIFAYVNDENPEASDRITEISFTPIKHQLKRDLEDWEETIKGKSEGGKKSAAIRLKLKQLEDSVSKLKILEDTSTNSTDNVNVNVNVNDNVNVFSIERCLEISLIDQRWVKANKATEDELRMFNKHLEQSGEYEKIPIDYKKHFKNLKALKPEIFKNGTSSIKKTVDLIRAAELRESTSASS